MVGQGLVVLPVASGRDRGVGHTDQEVGKEGRRPEEGSTEES